MNTVNHPEYGLLTIHERTGRSRRCTDSEGRSYTLSSKVLNKLCGQASAVLGSIPVAPEEFVHSVKLYLDGLSGPEQDRTAREVWALADTYLVAPTK